MRLLDEIKDKPLSYVTLLLTYNEAGELRNQLDRLIEHYGKIGHHHVSDNDYQREITIAIYNESDISEFSERIQQLIRKDE